MVRLGIAIKNYRQVKAKQDKALKAALRQLDRKPGEEAAYAENKIKGLYRTRVHVRSGNLWRSVHQSHRKVKGRVEATVGTPVVYAISHEIGATVRPKGNQRDIIVGRAPLGSRKYSPGQLIHHRGGGKMLAIPVGNALKKSGAAKSAKIDLSGVQMSGGAPFKTWVSRSGRALMFSKQRANLKWSKPEVIAALKKSVRIPPRRVFATTAKLVHRKFGTDVSVAIEREWKRIK